MNAIARSLSFELRDQIKSLDEFLDLVQEAQRAGQYLKDRYENIEKGVPVRDLDEAQSAWATAIDAIRTR